MDPTPASRSRHNEIERRRWSDLCEVMDLGRIPTLMPRLEKRWRLPNRESVATDLRRRIDEYGQVDQIGQFRPRGICTVENYHGRGVAFCEIRTQAVCPIVAGSSLEVERMPLRRLSSE